MDARYTGLIDELTAAMGAAFARCGYEARFGEVVSSARPDLAQFQCNGAMGLAAQARQNPFPIAERVVAELRADGPFRNVAVVRPGFINFDVNDALLAEKVATLPTGGWSEAVPPAKPLSVVLDFGGANVAKPLHVGHLRSAIIGESIKRTARYLGHKVVGDVHLGDWGLQMGMLICEIRERRPDLPYFDPAITSGYPEESPVTIADLDEYYPAAARKAKEDESFMAAARQATCELQAGRPGYIALWRRMVDVSIADLKVDYAKLGVEFDLWLGESDAECDVGPLLEMAQYSGLAYESEGALVVDIAEPADAHTLPPILLRKADGAALYSTTDLATIAQRGRNFAPDAMLYVVDNRQSAHFVQVFRAARKLGIVAPGVLLEHIGFGTMNGTDGKPFKTRAGGTMKLKDLIGMVTDRALERLKEAEIGSQYSEEEQQEIARKVGISMLKFADFSNARTKDYVFDLDRFSSFEGRTGPYLLYTTVRANSILRKAAEAGFEPGRLLPPSGEAERALLLHLSRFGEALNRAWEKRAPSELCEYTYGLAVAFSAFYRDHHILTEENPAVRASYLTLVRVFRDTIGAALDLLGIEIPDRM